MKLMLAKRHKLILFFVGITLLLVVAGVYGVMRQHSRGQKRSDLEVRREIKAEYFEPYKDYRGEPDGIERPTNINGVTAASADERGTDGPLDCTLYYTASKRVIARYAEGSGFNATGDTYPTLIVEDAAFSSNQLLGAITQFCGLNVPPGQ